MKKKVFLSIITFVLILVSVAACGSSDSKTDSTNIILGDNITIDGDGASVNDNNITITASGTYNVSGTLKDGMIEINAPDQAVDLVLNGADIKNSKGPAVLCSAASKVTVTLTDSTTNTLIDGGTSNYAAALYSASSIIINGNGSLIVSGNNKEAITSKMNVDIESGNIHLTAVNDGINANKEDISIVTIKGGYLYIEAGKNGIVSNGSINITGGTVIALSDPNDKNGGLDASGKLIIAGGTVIATGTENATPDSGSSQKSVLVNYNTTQPAGTLFAIQKDDTNILAFAPAKAYKQLLYSASTIADKVSYDIYTGGSAKGDVVDGLYTKATYTTGTLVSTLTTESVNNTISNVATGNTPTTATTNGLGKTSDKTLNNTPAKSSTDTSTKTKTDNKTDRATGTPPTGDAPTGTPPDKPTDTTTTK